MIPLHPAPLRDFDYIGFHYYSLTWCCNWRQTFFTQEDRVELVRTQFLRASAETGVAIVAYCFMPEHVHQVVKGDNPNADGKRYFSKAKQYSGFYFKKAFASTLWQRYGYDHVLLRDDEPRTAVRYVIENPMRRGLVGKVEDYPFTGSAVYSMAELIEWVYAI